MKRFALSLVIFQGLLVAVNLAVYRSFIAAFGAPAAPWNAVFGWLFVALSFTFFAASLITRRSKHPAAGAFYAFSVYWFGMVNFLFVGAFFLFVAMVLLYGINIYIPAAILGAIAFGVSFLLFLYAAWQARRAEIVRVDVALRGLPESWKNRNVAFVSDIHLGDVQMKGFAKKVVARVRSLHPYALFIGGDLFDGPACDESALLEPFRALASELPGGVWFVTGNHEYYLPDPQAAFSEIKDAGIRIIDNDVVDLDGMQLAGVDDKASADPEAFARIMHGMKIDPSRASILLKHIPQHLEAAAKKGISLELCGHTHNGQLFPLQAVVKRIYKGYGYGLHRFGEIMQIYTSSGAGTWGPPLRFGTRSEVIDLHFSLKES